MSFKDALDGFIKKHAGNIPEKDIPKLIFHDVNGKTYRFSNYNDERIPILLPTLVSCGWAEAEDAAKSVLQKEETKEKSETEKEEPERIIPHEKIGSQPVETKEEASEITPIKKDKPFSK